MLVSRALDDKEIQLKRQNRIFFQVSCAGHEVIQVVAGAHARSGYDWFNLYYRDRAFALQLGITPLQQMLQAVGAAEDTMSGGRQMPSHFSSRKLHIVTVSSPTGTQFHHAVGIAEAGRRSLTLGHPDLIDRTNARGDEVVFVTTGEGTTAEGEFWESLSTACNLRLPVVYIVEDNGYAISVPVEVNTPGGSISALLSGFPHLKIVECDGTDVVESWRAVGEATAYARSGAGPSLVHAHVIRPYSHSLSDDERSYKTEVMRAEEASRDPLRRTSDLLREVFSVTDGELEALAAEVTAEVNAATDEALQAPQPEAHTIRDHLYSTVDPGGPDFDTVPDAPVEASETTMVDLINQTLRDEMRRDPRIIVFGQDVADVSHDELLHSVAGKGGVFKVTAGLQREFGSTRVFNSPLAEANIVGRAVGMALRGLKPVVEIQFFDYIWPAMMQIRNELAMIRFRSAGDWNCPIVIRVTYGGYLKGGSLYHSQTGESIFAHTPGLRVVLPATALDAAGLLRTAIRCDDPVVFLEHKHLYRQVYAKSVYPGPDFMIPFGKARKVREGTAVTVVSCGALVQRSLTAARTLEEEGISVEVLDLRSLNPFDMEAIADSVRKTSRVVIAYEDAMSWGIGAEFAARIADELFAWLDAPVRRVASQDTWVAYSPQLERAILPEADEIAEAVREVARY